MKFRFQHILPFVVIPLFSSLPIFSQNYPAYGPEKKVMINGLTFDAMEPFISPDGNTLFFNSLNSGGNTNLYYASKLNDTTFNYIGLVGGTYDPSPNHLDGVPSHDSLNNFFWTSLRGYPASMENLHRGIYSSGNVGNISRVYGNFNIYNFNYPYGWLIMDAAINFTGNTLYYCNAKFDFSNTACNGVPCESKLGIAQKLNDSTFNKVLNSDGIFKNINDTVNYILYAPQTSKNELELYFTRLQKGTYNTEICVAVRNYITDTFSLPALIHANPGFVPEAASPTSDQQKIYYHQKDGSGIFHVYLRYRNGFTGITKTTSPQNLFSLFPNPIEDYLQVKPSDCSQDWIINIYSSAGKLLQSEKNCKTLLVSGLSSGLYFFEFLQNGTTKSTKFIKQ